MSPFIAGIIAWATANPVTAIGIALAVYAFFTKKITIDGLLAKIGELLKPSPVPPPVVGPVSPTSPLIQQLIDLLLKSHASGDTATHEAVLKVLSATRGS